MDVFWVLIIITAIILAGLIALLVWRLAYPARWHLNMLRHGSEKNRFRALQYFTAHFDIQVLRYAFAIMETETAGPAVRAAAAALLSKALDGERAKKAMVNHLDHDDLQVRKNSMITLMTLDPWTPLPPLFQALGGMVQNPAFSESDVQELTGALKRRFEAEPPSQEEAAACTGALFDALPNIKNAYPQGPVSHRFLFCLELLDLLGQGPEQRVNAFADYMHRFLMEPVVRLFLESGFTRDMLFQNLEAALAVEETRPHRVKGLLMFIEQGVKAEAWDLKDADSYDILNKVLQSAVWRHRAGAVKCLGLTGHDHTFDRLLSVWVLDGHPDVRQAAEKLLKETGSADPLASTAHIVTEAGARALIKLWLDRRLKDYDEKVLPKKGELVKLASALARTPRSANKHAAVLDKVMMVHETPPETHTVTETVEKLIGYEDEHGRGVSIKNPGTEDYSDVRAVVEHEEIKRTVTDRPGRVRVEIDQVALLEHTAHLV